MRVYATEQERKAEWGPGPWQDEPDKVQWTDPLTGLPCMVRRSRRGVWCGYVAVAEGHPWFGVAWDDVEPCPDVHGGLNYFDFCMEGPEATSICHVPDPGQPDHVWWLGFDCGHSFDYVPSDADLMADLDAIAERYGTPFRQMYWTMDLVMRETLALALQAMQASTQRALPRGATTA